MKLELKLVGDLPLDQRVGEITKELTQAGIPIVPPDGRGEYPALPQGQLGNWRFRRHWFYWTANAPKGRGLSRAEAERLYSIGKSCDFRAGGYSGGGAPLNAVTSEAGTVDCYHIDTLDNLKDFAELIVPK